MKKPLVVIGGATACGKTALSIEIAKKINGEIISADSMQVYRKMDIGTAKVSKDEQKEIKHYLIDEFNPDEEYNVMIFQKKAKEYMEKIWADNKIPIIVGGTGFYINALLFDNDFKETETDHTFRNKCYEEAEEFGVDYLYDKLLKIDKEYADIVHANNVKRVVRALEYFHFTGEKFSTHNAQQKEKTSPYDHKVIILTMDRQQLYDRIEQRIDIMMQEGLLKEVKSLLDEGYKEDLVSMQGLGYKEFIPYFKKDIDLDEAVEQLKKGTRHFAKRQNTWFTRQIEGLNLNFSKLSLDEALDESLKYISNSNKK